LSRDIPITEYEPKNKNGNHWGSNASKEQVAKMLQQLLESKGILQNLN
jgi:crossover junction endodeoxyribonuclease RuvC